jgi:hypothetical protein
MITIFAENFALVKLHTNSVPVDPLSGIFMHKVSEVSVKSVILYIHRWASLPQTVTVTSFPLLTK